MTRMRNNAVLIGRANCPCLVGALLFLAVVGVPVVAKEGPLEIIRVGLDKKSFNPSKGEAVNVGFEITEQADVQVIVYDRLGTEVRSFGLPGIEAGRHSITWDGRRADGKPAAGDVFLYVIEARAEDGRKVTHNPARETGGLEVKPLEYTLDREAGRIEYVLPKACMIRVRAGLKDGMFGKSLFDWKPSTAGRHVYRWDGKDESGMMYLLKHHDLDLRLTCYTLPANTIITTGTVVPFAPDANPHAGVAKQRSRLWATKGKYFHYRHDPRICRQPRFKVLFPLKDKLSDEGHPVVSGATQIRVELDPRDARHLINTRFEIMIFVDGIFLYEIEEGSSPFTFSWDTKGFAKGAHIVTVNLVGYDDHIGIVSRKVIVGG